MSKNFNDISLKDRGSAYSDAVEYKGDGTYVYTFQIFTGWDKKNGFKIKTPRNGTYIFDESGTKIKGFYGQIIRLLGINGICLEKL